MNGKDAEGSFRDLIEIGPYLSRVSEKTHEILSQDSRVNFEL
jgi:hypothetical protein